MKVLAITAGLLYFSQHLNATDYYVKANGGTGSGLNDANAWNYAHFLTRTFNPGDKIRFKRGNVFNGQLTIASSGIAGNPVSYGAYGTGADPVINGFTTLTNWQFAGNGLYYVSLTTSPRVLSFNGNLQPKGRYPKSGYLTYESTSGIYSISDNELPASPSWIGAQIAVKKERWWIDVGTVTAHENGGALLFKGTSFLQKNKSGYGYFFQNDAKACTGLGDWYYNLTEQRLYMYFGRNSPADYIVKAGTTDILIRLNNKSYINIENLTLDGANNEAASVIGSSSNINFSNVHIKHSYVGYYLDGSANNITVNGGSIIDIGNMGVRTPSNVFTVANVTIANCVLTNIGMFPGMGGNGTSSYSGIFMQGDGHKVSGCTISNVGYNGISLNHNNFLIENNVISGTCATKDDGAAIYTIRSSPKDPLYTNRIIRNNIIRNTARTAAVGIPETVGKSHGIYFDNNVVNILLENNVVTNAYGRAYFFHNVSLCTIRNNIAFQNAFGEYDFSNDNLTRTRTKNIVFTGNTAVNSSATTPYLSYRTPTGVNDFNLWGSFDNNYFFSANINGVQSYINYFSTQNLAAWKSYSGLETGSQEAVYNSKQVRLEINETGTPITRSLDHTYSTPFGTHYKSRSITIPPYTGVILIRTR